MWKYNHTDEMYTGRFDRSDKLFHSDVYLGQDFSDGIKHWKYIKRERRNGRWVYYYEDAKADSLNQKRAEAESNYYKTMSKSYHSSDENVRAAARRYENTKGKGGLYVGDKQISTLRKLESAEKKHHKAHAKWRNHMFITAPTRALAKGAVGIANTASSIGQKIKKGKKAIANLFKKKKKK